MSEDQIPAEAVRLAMTSRARDLMDLPDPMVLSDERLTRRMLAAAAPVLADAVAARILEHMERYFPAGQDRGSAPRRWLRAGAQIAAGAFSSEADTKRRAAEALTAHLETPAPDG